MKMKLYVLPGAQCWSYFLCAWPVCAKWQVVRSRSGYRVIPAAVGHGLGRKYSPGDWPHAQTASALDPAPPNSLSEVNHNLPALTTLPRTEQGGGKKYREDRKKDAKTWLCIPTVPLVFTHLMS